MARIAKTIPLSQKSAGDAAVDGLLAGASAGLVMAVVLMVAGLGAGEGPATTLGRFDPAGSALWLIGALSHLAMSAVYGVFFGMIYRLVGSGRHAGLKSGVVLGLAYGFILLLMAQGLAATPAGIPLREFPALHFAIAHLVYGVVLGWLIGRN